MTDEAALEEPGRTKPEKGRIKGKCSERIRG